MKSFHQPAQPLRGETVAYAVLGLAGAASLLLAVFAMFDFVNGQSRVVAALEAPAADASGAALAQVLTNSAPGDTPRVVPETSLPASQPLPTPVSLPGAREPFHG